MREVHFQSLDLNLLRVFDALAEERSVTRAGERLGLTQSAVSHALNRLRYALEDELFLRGPDGMKPTPRATEIWPELRRGLLLLQHAVAPTEFDPSDAERSFNIAASSYTGEVLLPHLVARVRAEAPKVQLNVRGLDAGVPEALEAGRLDLVIGVFGRIAEMFSRQTLFQEGLVWVVRADHPALQGGEASQKSLQKLPLAVLTPTDEGVDSERGARLIERRVIWEELASDQTLLGRDARQRVRVVVDNAHAVLAIVSSSDLVAIAPRRLAKSRCEPLGLKLVEATGLGPGAVVDAVWRADQTSHPALTWLRDKLAEAALDA
jgi:DNA-binding transcriptional LysR family regulator